MTTADDRVVDQAGASEDAPAAPSFTDRKGNTWRPHVTFGVLRNLEKRSGVSIFKGQDALENMTIDAFQTALFLACREEAREREIKFEEFQELLDCGPGLPMINAFGEALAAFMGMGEEKEGGEESDPDLPPVRGNDGA